MKVTFHLHPKMPQPKTIIHKDQGRQIIGMVRNPRKKGTPTRLRLAASWKWRASREPQSKCKKSDPADLRVNPST